MLWLYKEQQYCKGKLVVMVNAFDLGVSPQGAQRFYLTLMSGYFDVS
jgi:hypothetical protein